MKATMKKALMLAVGAVLVSGMGGLAAEIEGVVFKDGVTAQGQQLPIRGTGLFRYLGFIKAYVGALYMPADVGSERVLEDVPKRLEIEYFHTINAEDFGAATNKLLAENLDAETLERLRARVDRHNALYRDVAPGDRYSLTYVPGKGTELALNDAPLGVIEGHDFATAIYAMWLGDSPINKTFKRQLLGV